MVNVRRRISALAALLAGVLVVTGVVTGVGRAEAGDSYSKLPTVRQVQRIFPEVTERSYDGDAGHGPLYPSCAGVDTPEGPGTVVHLHGGFYWDDHSDRDAVPGSYLLVFRTVRKAKSAMTKLRRHLTACLGYREDVDVYSRYRRIPTPKLGDARVGYQGSWQTTFEDPYPRFRSIWMRDGKTVIAASVSRVHGKLPANKTKQFAALALRASRR